MTKGAVRARAAVKGAWAVALVACGGHKSPQMPENIGAASYTPPRQLPAATLVAPPDPAPPGLDAHVLVNVPENGIGPFLARRGDVAMAAYVGSSQDHGRRVVSVPVAGDGTPRGEARVLAPLAADATSLVLHPMGGPRGGFLAAWTSLADRGESLTMVAMDDAGRPRGEPIELARTKDDVVWTGIATTPAGAVVTWAEEPRGGEASLVAVAIGPDGALRGVPSRIARGVASWQLVEARDGAGLALVTREAGDAKKSDVAWLRIDDDARPAGPPVPVAIGQRLGADVDAARVDDGALLAWTDVSQADPQPVIARVDAAGHVEGPKRVTSRGAGGVLAGLAPGLVAWDEPSRRGGGARHVLVARVTTAPALDVKEPLPLALEGRGDPEIARAGDGFALLAPARACETAATTCDDAPVGPTFVRLGDDLGVVQVEPLRLGPTRDRATLGWSLACEPSSGGCLALAAVESDGVPRVLAVDLAKRASKFRAPLVPPPPPGAPVVEALDTVASGEPLADLASAPLGDGAILATLTAGNEEAKRDDSSIVSVRLLARDGAVVATTRITKRALPVGGVAVAGTGRAEDGAAVAWVARDGGDPQVHVTRVDARGKVARDVQLTSAKGDASDVAITWTGERWIVAWVDARDGNGEVYATTLDRDARDVGKGQRITSAPGDASDVALLAAPGGVWCAWADPRESPKDGFADVYVAPLRPGDAARAGDEVRVLATAAHSRSPALAARPGRSDDDVAVAWIEEAPMGADPGRARAYGAMIAHLDARTGRPRAEPSHLSVAGDGFPTAIVLDGSSELHAVLARASADAMTLDGLDLGARDDAKAYPLVTLDGPPSLDVALSLAGRALYFNDEGPDAEGKRARRATIRWPR